MAAHAAGMCGWRTLGGAVDRGKSGASPGCLGEEGCLGLHLYGNGESPRPRLHRILCSHFSGEKKGAEWPESQGKMTMWSG